MSDFQWKTDEDEWETSLDAERIPKQAPWRGLALLGGMLAVLLIAGAIFWTQIQDEVSQVTLRTDDVVRNTYEHVYQTAQAGDIDVFRQVVSARDENWALATQRMVIDQGLIDRAPFGLTTISELPRIVELEVAPDLLSAEMQTQIDYAVHVGNGVTQTVTLQRHEFFGRGGNQAWLFTAPPEDYWGGAFEQTGRTFDLVGNERDSDLIRRIHSDLDSLFNQLCQQDPALTCPEGYRRSIFFSTNAESMLDLSVQSRLQGDVRTITLPTPSLVGYSTNQASYDALVAGYAKLVFLQTSAELMGYSCCTNVEGFDALVEDQLVTLGIMAASFSAE